MPIISLTLYSQEFGTDMIVSPARRSLRIQRRSTSIMGMADRDLSDDTECVYRPNKLIDYNLS